MLIKNRLKEHKILSITLSVIFFIILWVIYAIIYFIHWDNNKIQTERVDISDFSNTLEIDKEWTLLSYPEVTILAETDWELVSLNVSEWDIVEEWDILMQIWNPDDSEETIDKLDRQILWKYSEFYENMDQYNEFQMQYWQEISDLEKELLQDNAALQIATDTNDTQTIKKMQNEIQELNRKLTILKTERDNLKNSVTNLEDEINSANKESIDLYYEFDRKTPRATIPWIIWNIYVQEWDEIQNWDKLCTIIDNTYSPEISVWLDFNEYVLTQDLTWVLITTENENRWNSYYEWEIYTRSPILNEEWKYTITVRILEEVSDLILSDKNTKITVIFTKDFPTIWIPTNCFTEIWKNNWMLTLRDGEVITWKEVWIKNKWENWINVDNLVLFWLEKEDEKDWIDLCIEDWNNEWYKDESVVERRNEFETLEDFCSEFIKVNPMYWSGHRNLAIVSELWWPGEKIEVLCK